jgi:hypothetical protein
MKKTIIALLAFFSSGMLAAQGTVINDANAESRPINKSFNAIKVSDGIDLYLTQSSEEAVVVSASKEKYVPNIKVEVRDNTLHIWYNAPGGIQVNLGHREMRAYVSFKTLEKLNASGASDVHVTGEIAQPALNMSLSGASDFKGQVKIGNLSLDLSGASDVRISGSVTNLNITAEGASDVKAYELAADVCTVKASGASDVSITVNKELSAHATGASGIKYKGGAIVKSLQTNGASSVSKKS